MKWGKSKFNQYLPYLSSKKYEITSKNPTYQRFLNNSKSSPQFLKKYSVNLEKKIGQNYSILSNFCNIGQKTTKSSWWIVTKGESISLIKFFKKYFKWIKHAPLWIKSFPTIPRALGGGREGSVVWEILTWPLWSPLGLCAFGSDLGILSKMPFLSPLCRVLCLMKFYLGFIKQTLPSFIDI